MTDPKRSEMNSKATDALGVTVNRPRSYLGQAESGIGPESVTLVARSIRHYRAVLLCFIVASVVWSVVAGALSFSGQISLREPGLSCPARTEELLMAYGAPILGGVLVGVLVGGMYLLFKALRGDPRSMTIPLTSISIVKHKGRVFVLRAAFDGARHPGNRTVVARSREDAIAVESGLATGGG